jgi:hypothetical protein
VSEEFGMVEIWEQTEGGAPPVKRSFPVYACGHCSAQVILNPKRSRPRLKCLKCNRFLCEQNELCHADCTPLYAMVADKMENVGRWAQHVPALMHGITTLDEAQKFNSSRLEV